MKSTPTITRGRTFIRTYDWHGTNEGWTEEECLIFTYADGRVRKQLLHYCDADDWAEFNRQEGARLDAELARQAQEHAEQRIGEQRIELERIAS